MFTVQGFRVALCAIIIVGRSGLAIASCNIPHAATVKPLLSRCLGIRGALNSDLSYIHYVHELLLATPTAISARSS